jgi:hypothetical protein
MGSGELPFFIQWLTEMHPSKDGNSVAKITKIVIADDEELANSWFKNEINSGLTDIQIEWIKPELNEGEKGIVKVEIGLKDHSIIIE